MSLQEATTTKAGKVFGPWTSCQNIFAYALATRKFRQNPKMSQSTTPAGSTMTSWKRPDEVSNLLGC
jgi:hypothetical protein